MLIDCQSCQMRELACGDCVVTLLLGPVVLSEHSQTFEVLAGAGLTPPLRLVENDGPFELPGTGRVAG